MKLILINGSSCSGKSTVVKSVLKEHDRLFHLSYDSLKWSFSRYSPDRHISDVRTLMLSVAEAVFALKYDVICDSVLYKEPREALIALATKHGCDIVEINLEADYETLLKRFDERVVRAKANPEVRISNLSQERWKEMYKLYQSEKNSSAPTVRTDKQSIEATFKEVLQLI